MTILESLQKLHEQIRKDFWKDREAAEFKGKWSDDGDHGCTCCGFVVENEEGAF